MKWLRGRWSVGSVREESGMAKLWHYLFGHEWDGCKCRGCPAFKPNGIEADHEWDGCRCRRCHETRPHIFSPGSCICQRQGCRAANPQAILDDHDWYGCRCYRCDETRPHI